MKREPSLINPLAECRPDSEPPDCLRTEVWGLALPGADSPTVIWLRATAEREAASELKEAVECAVNQLDYLRELWGDEGVPRSWAEATPPNLWLGVSVENQKYADERIPILLDTPAAVRFVSYEPALGPVDFGAMRCGHLFDSEGAPYYDALRGSSWWGGTGEHGCAGPSINWVIAGGESGPNRRPCEVAWFEDVARQCKEAGTACFIKQDAGPKPGLQGRISDELWAVKEFPKTQPIPEAATRGN